MEIYRNKFAGKIANLWFMVKSSKSPYLDKEELEFINKSSRELHNWSTDALAAIKEE